MAPTEAPMKNTNNNFLRLNLQYQKTNNVSLRNRTHDLSPCVWEVMGSIPVGDREITSWKMRAYDFYSRIEFSDTYQRVNKNGTKHFSCL